LNTIIEEWENGRIGERENRRKGELEKGRIGERENWRKGELEKGRIGENWSLQ